MNKIAENCESKEGLSRNVENPYKKLGDKEKGRLTTSGAKGDGVLSKLIELLNKNNRINMLRNISLTYGRLYREKNGIAQVEVMTATSLPDDRIKEILDVIKNQLKGNTLEITKKIASILIGGFSVKVVSLILDASIKN